MWYNIYYCNDIALLYDFINKIQQYKTKKHCIILNFIPWISNILLKIFVSVTDTTTNVAAPGSISDECPS